MKRPCKRYRQVKLTDDNTLAHRVKAAEALGHPLPPRAEVHHVDGTKAETSGLVICPDAAYHKALHVRMRIRAAGGNPWTDRICTYCRQPKPLATAFSTLKSYACRPCDAAYQKRRRTCQLSK